MSKFKCVKKIHFFHLYYDDLIIVISKRKWASLFTKIYSFYTIY